MPRLDRCDANAPGRDSGEGRAPHRALEVRRPRPSTSPNTMAGACGCKALMDIWWTAPSEPLARAVSVGVCWGQEVGSVTEGVCLFVCLFFFHLPVLKGEPRGPSLFGHRAVVFGDASDTYRPGGAMVIEAPKALRGCFPTF